MNFTLFITSTSSAGDVRRLSNANYQYIEHAPFTCWDSVHELFVQNWKRSQANSGEIEVRIESIDSDAYRLLKPMSVRIAVRSEDEFIASFPEAGISMSGDSTTESLQLLKSHLVALYELFKKEHKIGPEPLRQRKILGEYIGKKGR